MSNLSPITTLKTGPNTNVLVGVPIIYKIAMKALCGETTSKVTCEISAFHKFVKNPITIIGIFQKVVLEISKNSHLTSFTSL